MKFNRRLRYLSAPLFLAFLIGCGGKTALKLTVAKNIRELLPIFSSDSYENKAILRVLDAAHAGKNAWCARPVIASGLGRELTAAERSAFDKHENGIMLRLGCEAFFHLNESEPEISMAYADEKMDVRQEAKHECISVGFVQPYVMAAGGRCSSLTIIDASFRTLRLHAVLLPMLLAEEFRGIDEVYSEFERATGMRIGELCGDRYAVRCKIELSRFVSANRGRLKVRLHLGEIQDFPFADIGDKSMVYLSNAIDPNFMDKEEFLRLKTQLAKGNGNTVVYHQADSENFGVYEFTGQEFRAICADDFIVSRKGRYTADRCKYIPGSTAKYVNYFDALAGKRPEKCDFLNAK
ncbi:MAG: hypothetical protein KF713_16565 [Turneriella sp.]|nr:hypothetical protein [Turneriella sp.]